MNADNVLRDTPIHLACYKGHLHIVKWLYQQGANLRVLNEMGSSCFMLASREGHLTIMYWLLEHGALNYYDEDDEEYETPDNASNPNPNGGNNSPLVPIDPHQPIWRPGNEEDDEVFVSKGGDMSVRWRTGAGHVSVACLRRAMSTQHDQRQWDLLIKHVTERIALHTLFLDLILPSATTLSYFKYFSNLTYVAKNANIMGLLAEFLSVPTGRALRNLRETFLLMHGTEPVSSQTRLD